jgi:type IV pilus assembly protein PilW
MKMPTLIAFAKHEGIHYAWPRQGLNDYEDVIKSKIQFALQFNHNPQPAKIFLKRQQGMTLVEILIAMLLGAFLLGGVVQIFSDTKQSYRMQEGLSRLQENGRFALEFISQDLRMAGFFGCLSSNFNSSNIENELKNPTAFGWDVATPLMGYDNVSASFTNVASVVVGTDVIVMRGLYGNAVPLISPYTNSSQMFVDSNFNSDCPTSSATTCHEGEILMVTDCSQGTIFQATNTTNISSGTGVNVVHSATNTYTPGNASPPTFNKTYGPGSQIARFTTYAYYIRINPGNQPALYRSSLNVTGGATNAMNAEELIEGIENLQVTYGVDTNADGTANYYVAAGDVATWAQVVSARISVTVRSIDDNLASTTSNYTFNGASTSDRRLRRNFNTTVALRNRLR